MKIGRNWNVMLAGIAGLVLMLWPVSIPAEQDGISGGPQLLPAVADIPDAPVGKRTPLPEISTKDYEFWDKTIRDPFKAPKSKQLCSAGVIEACDVPEKPSGSSGS